MSMSIKELKVKIPLVPSGGKNSPSNTSPYKQGDTYTNKYGEPWVFDGAEWVSQFSGARTKGVTVADYDDIELLETEIPDMSRKLRFN